jgi:hypothetical protein
MLWRSRAPRVALRPPPTLQPPTRRPPLARPRPSYVGLRAAGAGVRVAGCQGGGVRAPPFPRGRGAPGHAEQPRAGAARAAGPPTSTHPPLLLLFQQQGARGRAARPPATRMRTEGAATRGPPLRRGLPPPRAAQPLCRPTLRAPAGLLVPATGTARHTYACCFHRSLLAGAPLLGRSPAGARARLRGLGPRPESTANPGPHACSRGVWLQGAQETCPRGFVNNAFWYGGAGFCLTGWLGTRECRRARGPRCALRASSLQGSAVAAIARLRTPQPFLRGNRLPGALQPDSIPAQDTTGGAIVGTPGTAASCAPLPPESFAIDCGPGIHAPGNLHSSTHIYPHPVGGGAWPVFVTPTDLIRTEPSHRKTICACLPRGGPSWGSPARRVFRCAVLTA